MIAIDEEVGAVMEIDFNPEGIEEVKETFPVTTEAIGLETPIEAQVFNKGDSEINREDLEMILGGMIMTLGSDLALLVDMKRQKIPEVLSLTLVLLRLWTLFRDPTI